MGRTVGPSPPSLDPQEATLAPPTCFGAWLDNLAQKAGGWPEGAAVYAIEGLNKTQVLLTGDVPIGLRRDGHAKFTPRTKGCTEYRAVVTIAEYRAALPAPLPAKLAEASL